LFSFLSLLRFTVPIAAMAGTQQKTTIKSKVVTFIQVQSMFLTVLEQIAPTFHLGIGLVLNFNPSVAAIFVD
jgi:hypothetical protein